MKRKKRGIRGWEQLWSTLNCVTLWELGHLSHSESYIKSFIWMYVHVAKLAFCSYLYLQKVCKQIPSFMCEYSIMSRVLCLCEKEKAWGCMCVYLLSYWAWHIQVHIHWRRQKSWWRPCEAEERQESRHTSLWGANECEDRDRGRDGNEIEQEGKWDRRVRRQLEERM